MKKILLIMVIMASLLTADKICVSGGQGILICTDEDGNEEIIYLPYEQKGIQNGNT